MHAASLRWALQREGRLHFNANLRPFKSAKTSKANAWYTNAFMLTCIILAYASTSWIFVMINVSGTENYYCGENLTGTNDVAPCLATAYSMATVNGIALMTLAIGLIGQSIVGSICLYKMQSAPTWSPNPIDIAAAVLSSGAIDYAICCSLRSVHDVKGLACPLTLRSKQGPAYFAHKQVRLVFYFVWATVVLVALWGGILMMVTRFVFLTWWYNHGKQKLVLFPPGDRSTKKRGWRLLSRSPQARLFWPSLCKRALSCIQLHHPDLLHGTDASRTEPALRRAPCQRCSRRAYVRSKGKKGLKRGNTKALVSVMTSIPAIVLLILKPALHWLLGLAVQVYYTIGAIMFIPQIFYLDVGLVLLASFVTACTFWCPKGPQPATYGHLQTLVDLIDEWPEGGEKMFWGRKELSSCVEFSDKLPADEFGSPIVQTGQDFNGFVDEISAEFDNINSRNRR